MSPAKSYAAIFLLFLCVHCSMAALTIGFRELDRHVPESSGVATIDLTKTGPNHKDIVVLVSALTYSEFKAMNREFPAEFEELSLPDPAEWKQDFKRNGPTRVTFDPSSTNEEREIEIPLVDDEINEADEGFVLVIEMEDNGDRESVGEEIKLVRAGVALIRVADDDPIRLGFEKPEYTVAEEDELLDVYVTKNGVDSEQVLRVRVQNSPTGSAMEGEDYSADGTTELVFNPKDDRLPIPVQIIDNQLPEETENFRLSLSKDVTQIAQGLGLGLSVTTVYITDDDPVFISFEVEDYTVNESEEMFRERGDYGRLNDEPVNLPTFDDDHRMCVIVPITNDNDVEPEQFRIRFIPNSGTSPNVHILSSVINVTIVDDDAEDECAWGLDDCGDNTDCVDLLDGYKCVCKEGFVGNGIDCYELTCPVLDAPANGQIMYGSDMTAPFSIGTIATYSCDDRFDLLGDTPERMCESAGWSGTAPRCIHSSDHDCHRYALCEPRPEGNACVCRSGYSGDGEMCTDINECADGTHSCNPLAVCHNLRGSYYCRCRAGYTTIGKTQCRDMNECRLHRDRCHRNAICTNTIGSYNCTCRSGYRGNGFQCTGRTPVQQPQRPSSRSGTRRRTSKKTPRSRTTPHRRGRHH